MIPEPPDDEYPRVPLELAQQIIERLQRAVSEARKDGETDGVVNLIERTYGIPAGTKPEDIPPEIAREALELVANISVNVALTDLNCLLVFLINLMQQMDSVIGFAAYLRDNGHERIGEYLRELAVPYRIQ